MAGISMGRRSTVLLVAGLLAALATAALISYVRGIEDRAFDGARTVGVFVAKAPIPAGTSGDEVASRGLVGREAVPVKVRVDGAIGSLREIRGKVAVVNVLPGEQLIGARFVTPGRASGVLPIPQGRQAMSVEVGVPPGVAGFMQPGNRVSVIAKVAVGGESRAQFLLQDVPVLAVGRRVVAAAQGEDDQVAQTDRALITLAVRPADAEKLAFALFEGEIYFTLLPPGQKPARTPGRTSGNVYR